MTRKTTSAKALARSYRAERSLTFVAGVLAAAAGAAALLVGFRVFGDFRAARPVLDPIAVGWLGARATLAKIVAIVAGIALFAFGLWWLVRSLRPEGKPDLELDRAEGSALTVTASAIADAVRADAESVDGVSRARVRAVGGTDDPALRLTLWLRDGTDVRTVWEDIDARVLARARESLGVETLPTAVHIELDATDRRRVR